MRKAFIEPDMKVIMLNLNENIATSGVSGSVDYFAKGWKYNLDSENMVISSGVSKEDFESATGAATYAVDPDELDEYMRVSFETFMGIPSKCRA